MPCIGIHGIDVPGNEACGGLPVFSKNGGNELTFVGVARGWFLTARSVAGQTSSWRAHIVIVVERWVSPRNAFAEIRASPSPGNRPRPGGRRRAACRCAGD